MDTNGDGKVDQWCYFKDGLEVYRDIDSNFNGKADQYRWFNTAGSRWGVDKDEDGAIDNWAFISAEELTAEVVAAVAKQDGERFDRLLLTSSELRSLGLGDAKTQELNEKLAGAAAKFKEFVRQPGAAKLGAKWVHFSGGRPGIVPAGSDGATKELQVYENVTAVVQNDADHAQIQIGTIVKVGDVWRLTDAPQLPAEGQAESGAGGFFFRVAQAKTPQTPTAPTAGGDEKSREILDELEKLDAATARATTADEQAQLQAKRAVLLERMASAANKPEDRAMWVRQLIDMLGTAVQAGTYPDGAKQLAALVEKLKAGQDKDLAAHARFVQISAEYALTVQQKGADFSKVQGEWLKLLEEFVGDYPQSPDAAEAMIQLGLAQEFAGQEEEARKWYGRAAKDFGDLPTGKKASGAKTRLDSVGKTIQLTGKGASGGTVDVSKLRNQVVLIHYWASWSEPCKSDVAVLKDLVEKYGRLGFNVVGVNLDQSAEAMAGFVKENGLSWPQIYEQGGLDSRPAVEMGILTLPTMILVDQDGKVVNRNITAVELTAELRKMSQR
jgi:thiol-disulfide isomerase/thioredoxin